MPMHRMVIPGMTDGNDMLMGGAGDDLLLGGPGDDHLDGMGGSDVFDGGPGGDAIIGGDGIDYVSYIRSPSGVYVDIGNNFNIDDDDKPPVHGGYAEGDTLTEVEGIFGSVFGDTFRGDHQANYLFGYKGNDVIHGAGGADMIRGESGGDSLMGDGGNDKVYGDTGNDRVAGGAGDDMLWGGKGDDLLDGGAGDDRLEGGEGADTHQGGPGQDTAAYTMSPEAVMVNLKYAYDSDPTNDGEIAMGGHAEGDSFEKYQAKDAAGNAMGDAVESIERLHGSMHDDMLTGSDMGNRLFGGDGDDTLAGEGGNDLLFGMGGDDELFGGDGHDLLNGGPGADMLEGGDGTDTAHYGGSPEAVTVDLSNVDRDSGLRMPKAEGGDAEGDTIGTDVENVTGSDHQDLLMGDSGPNKLDGGKGSDWDNPLTTRVKEGGLFGMDGNDTLTGGDKDDEADYLDGGGGMDDLWGHGGNDLIIGGMGDDKPFMVADPDDPSEMITVRAGLYGGKGDDTLVVGRGSDHADGGTGADTASYVDIPAGTFDHDGDSTTTAQAGRVFATLGVNIDWDGDGTVDDATYNHDGDTGADATPEVAAFVGYGAAEDTALTATGDNNEVDTLVKIENLTGGGNNDVLGGNQYANELNGGKGNDVLTGGGGSDTFVFKRDDGNDTITDFSRFERDKIDLSDFELTAAMLDDAIRLGTDTATAAVIQFSNGQTLTLNGVESGDLSIDDFIL